MKISKIITDKYKLRIPPTVYYDLLADVQEVEEKQEPILDKIRAEIKDNRNDWIKGQDPEWHAYDRCLYIIDKYKAEK